MEAIGMEPGIKSSLCRVEQIQWERVCVVGGRAFPDGILFCLQLFLAFRGWLLPGRRAVWLPGHACLICVFRKHRLGWPVTVQHSNGLTADYSLKAF
jgi:hypothetical protein